MKTWLDKLIFKYLQQKNRKQIGWLRCILADVYVLDIVVD